MAFKLPLFSDYQIAAGNNNAAGLTAFEEIVPSGEDMYFIAPSGAGGYDPGVFEIRGNGTATFNGFKRQVLTFSYCTFPIANHLNDTYCSGNYNGLVTLRTKLEPDDSFANYNAIMYLPKPSEWQVGRSRDHIAPYPIRFLKLEAI